MKATISKKNRLNPFLVGFVIIYLGNLILANKLKTLNTNEVLSIVLIIGFAFSLISYFISRKAQPITENISYKKNEIFVLIALLIYITLSLMLSNDFICKGVSNGIIKEILIIGRKVLTFVVIPFMVYKLIFKFNTSDFGLSSNRNLIFTKRNLLIFGVISSIVLLINYFLGNAAMPIRQGVYSSTQLLTAIPLLFFWLFIEVGLVEEFFFRGLLQNRLAVFLKSNTSAICITALVFGIVHAPGMYLRGAGALDVIGSSPTLFAVIGYCIAVQSIAGFFLGIIWSKTRNLWLLMAIHTMIDLLPKLPNFIETWGI